MAKCYLIALCLLPSLLFADLGMEGDLMRDLSIVERVNCFLADRMPVYFNHLLYGGYFNMPSARVGHEGEIGIGWSYVPPYSNYNIRFEFMDRIEFSGNYRVFKGIDDPLLSATGFGDKSDKGANVKVALWLPEDTNYTIPGIAVGWEDLIGTKSFEGRYIVMTQVFPSQNLEASLGFGDMRFRGWFGGITWVPFRRCCNPYFKDIALVAEYDCIPYESETREPHPDGRTKKSPINFGCKYRLWNLVDLSASYVRGEKFAFSVSAFYNFGMSQGIMPKICDPLPYRSPINTQPLGSLRPCDVLVQELFFAFREQEFELIETWLSYDWCGSKILRLELVNCAYRYERDVRNRLNDLLAALIPSDIDQVVVVMDARGFPIQEYHFQMAFVRLYAERKVCPYELYVLSPLYDVSCPPYCRPSLLFKQKRIGFDYALYPKTYTAFGSARGKFKYMLGIRLGMDGYLWNEWYYQIVLGYPLSSDLDDVRDVDKLNPSQVINVRTDTVNYYKQKGLTVDQAFVQKNWNLGCGCFSRIAGGLFEVAYGGVAVEWLYYPMDGFWAAGIEGAYLKKRTYEGVGFTDQIRKLEGFHPTYRRYHGSQYFANLYCNFPDLDMDIGLKGGRFLAHDWGVKTTVSRYYPSGMRVYFWYTYTNGKDEINGHRYHDKGAGISIPLDIFFPYSSRTRWNYGMSAWLRDVGAIADTGNQLYYMIRDQRENRIGRCNTLF